MNTSVAINVLSNDTDPDPSNVLHITSIATAGVVGTVVIAPGAVLRNRLAPNVLIEEISVERRPVDATAGLTLAPGLVADAGIVWGEHVCSAFVCGREHRDEFVLRAP